MQASKLNQNFFVYPGHNVEKGDDEFVTLARLSPDQLRDRWATESGRYILDTWRAHRFDRKILDELVGRFYEHTDLRGAPLARENLSTADLSMVDLFSASLDGANLEYADLTSSYLSQSNLKGAKLDWAKMGEVLIDNAEFDSRTSFTGVRLNQIDFTLAEDLKDFAYGQQRIANLQGKYPKLAWILWATCDYGRSFPRFFAWCGGTILAFASVYTLIPGALTAKGFWNSLYFSITTFTTLGSDIQAVSAIGRLLVAIEASIGFMMTGLLVAILVKRTIGD